MLSVQSERTDLCPRCSRVRPWHVSICAPARSSIFAYSTVFSTVENTRNLAVTGIERFSCRVFTTHASERLRHWETQLGRTQAVDEVPLVLEEGPVVAPPRNVLRAPEVDVYGVAVGLDQLRRGEEVVRVVRAELHDERSVFGPALFPMHGVEVLFAVGLAYAFSEHLSNSAAA